MIRKADIVLAVILIVLGLTASYFLTAGKSAGSYVVVTVDGKEYAAFALSEDRTEEIVQNDHINKITIENGTVSMVFSNCTNQDCVMHSSISETGETIVCLPHKVIVEITGETPVYDSIAR